MTNIKLENLNITQGISILYATKSVSRETKISGIGDFNRDGYNDFIIGAPYTKDDSN